MTEQNDQTPAGKEAEGEKPEATNNSGENAGGKPQDQQAGGKPESQNFDEIKSMVATLSTNVDGFVKKINKEMARARRDIAELRGDDNVEGDKDGEKEGDPASKLASLTSEIERLKQQASSVNLKSEIMAQAVKLGFRDLNDACVLVDRSKITEKDGAYIGIKEALEALIQTKPYLLLREKPPEMDGEKGKETKKTDADKLKRRFGINS